MLLISFPALSFLSSPLALRGPPRPSSTFIHPHIRLGWQGCHVRIGSPSRLDPWVHFSRQNWTGVGSDSDACMQAKSSPVSDKQAIPSQGTCMLWICWTTYMYVHCCPFTKCYRLQPYRVVDSYCIDGVTVDSALLVHIRSRVFWLI